MSNKNCKRYIEIEPEEVLSRNGVFLIISCNEFGTRFDRKEKPMYKVLLNFRRDQQFGFIGGKVDAGETLREALSREVMEEISYDISNKNIKHLVSYSDKGFGIHSYYLHISVEEMKSIMKCVDTTNGDEISGLCLVNIFSNTLDGNKKLLENSYSATTKLELVRYMDIMNRTGCGLIED